MIPAKTDHGGQVVSPPHYCQAGVECIDVIRSILNYGVATAYQGLLWGSSMQYLWRCWHKGNTVQDLKKSRFYLDKLIEELETDEG